ncbi:kinase-like domain-containing protein [Mycena floridula]|nr:kinase-like domain-containing protein [Mycena floridula]
MVGKHFHNIGNGDGIVSWAENIRELENEVKRLKVAELFLEEFKDHAKKSNLPSTASGISEEQYDVEIKPVIAWMLEYRRPPGVQRWSSTTEFPTHTNKLGSTLNAFTHYTFIASAEQIVLADLQTAQSLDKQGNMVHVLFDVITHTPTGDSGVADHGIEGIADFSSKHHCVDRCATMSLLPLTKTQGDGVE